MTSKGVWGKTYRSKYTHFFGSVDHVSLCGKRFAALDWVLDTTDPTTIPDVCPKCLRMYKYYIQNGWRRPQMTTP